MHGEPPDKCWVLFNVCIYNKMSLAIDQNTSSDSDILYQDIKLSNKVLCSLLILVVCSSCIYFHVFDLHSEILLMKTTADCYVTAMKCV